ncbi:MAG: hypothetical protein QNJ73_04320 [Gammaproteobacteria bacterium]|nr:hypothetical protein [Gammaproteobacteria bacterium]
MDALQPSGSVPERKIPIRLLIMDVIGTILLGLGLFLMFAESPGQFTGDIEPKTVGTILMVLGIVFIVPLVVHLLNLGKLAARPGQGDGQAPGPPA